MNFAFRNRRNTRNEERLFLKRAVVVADVARNGTDFYLGYALRHLVVRKPDVAARDKAVRNVKEKRRGGGSSDKGVVPHAVKVADPNAEHILPEEADRPAVSKADRSACLVANLKALRVFRARAVRAWVLEKHLLDDVCRLRRKQLPRKFFVFRFMRKRGVNFVLKPAVDKRGV